MLIFANQDSQREEQQLQSYHSGVICNEKVSVPHRERRTKNINFSRIIRVSWVMRSFQSHREDHCRRPQSDSSEMLLT